MTNYDDWTDSEISIAVSKAQGFNDYHLEDKDYCNNPSDMDPIILEHKISIRHSSSMGYSFDEWDATVDNVVDGDCLCYGHADKKRLRAAAIVYLKMEEAKS